MGRWPRAAVPIGLPANGTGQATHAWPASEEATCERLTGEVRGAEGLVGGGDIEVAEVLPAEGIAGDLAVPSGATRTTQPTPERATQRCPSASTVSPSGTLLSSANRARVRPSPPISGGIQVIRSSPWRGGRSRERDHLPRKTG